AQVPYVGLVQLRYLNFRRRDAGETIHLLATERLRVLDCLRDAVTEFRDARRQTSDAAVAFLGIARRDIDEHHLDAGVLRDLREPALLPGVGKLDFDRLEAGVRRRLEALGKLELLEQHADVGAKPRHGSGPRRKPQAGTGLRTTGRSSIGRFTTTEITDSPIAISHTSW